MEEHIGQFDRQLREILAPSRPALPLQCIGNLAYGSLQEMPSCDAFYRVDDGVTYEAGLFWIVFAAGQLLKHCLGNCALAGGLGAVDNYVPAWCCKWLFGVSSYLGARLHEDDVRRQASSVS